MVLFTTLSDNAPWESDITVGLLVLGFVGVILGVLAIVGWGPFGYVRVNTAGSVGGEGRSGRERGEGRAYDAGGSGSGESIADERHDPT
jgi:hypothetical protein